MWLSRRDPIPRTLTEKKTQGSSAGFRKLDFPCVLRRNEDEEKETEADFRGGKKKNQHRGEEVTPLIRAFAVKARRSEFKSSAPMENRRPVCSLAQDGRRQVHPGSSRMEPV